MAVLYSCVFLLKHVYGFFKKKEKEINTFRYSHIIILPSYLNLLNFIFSDGFLVRMYNSNTQGIFLFPIYHRFATVLQQY